MPEFGGSVVLAADAMDGNGVASEVFDAVLGSPTGDGVVEGIDLRMTVVERPR